MMVNFQSKSFDRLNSNPIFSQSFEQSSHIISANINSFEDQAASASSCLDYSTGSVPIPTNFSPFFDFDGTKEGANQWGNFSDRRDTIGDSLGENGDMSDYFRFNINNRTNADFSLQAATANIQFEILDSQGNFISRSAPTGTLTDGLVRILTAGYYYLRVYTDIPTVKSEYNLTLNGVNLSQNIRPESSDVNFFNYDRNGRTDTNENQPNGGTFAGIRANQETVIVIHGWRNSDRTATIQDLLREVTKSDTQVLALDWSSIAQAEIDRGFVPMETAKWIAPVSRWLQGQLEKIGINPNQLTIIGHSLGSYVSSETGSLFGKVKNLVALDPAAGSPDQDYDVDGENGGIQTPKNFRDAANRSIAFVVADGLNNGTFGLLGNNDKAATADDSFLIKFAPGAKNNISDIEAHGAVIYTFTNILARNLLILPDLTLPKRERDRYNNNGAKNNNTQHEGIITAEWTGSDTDEEINLWRVKKLVTVVDSDGTERETWT